MMRRSSLLAVTILAVSILALTGCPYDNPPSGPSKNIDTWLVGQWEAHDIGGNVFRAVVAPSVPDHYAVTLRHSGKSDVTLDAWISQVEGFDILVVKFLDGPSLGKYALLHPELLSPGSAPVGGIKPTRIRVSELQLDPSAETLDPYHLRRDIRDALKAGTLLAPYDVAADRKAGGIRIPGSIIWTRTGSVALDGIAF